MYQEFFGVDEPPFRITPDTDRFFGGASRGSVLDALIYAITHGAGIVKVSGEVGSGKTMLCNMLQARLPDDVQRVYLPNPNVAPEEVLRAIAFELRLGVERDADRLELIHMLQDWLVDQHARGNRVVLFIEESQSMPLATLEEIRLLSNLETHTDKLLQIVLFGQPELDEMLRRPEIRQLRDRIAHSFRLTPLSRGEVREYLMFRMRAAGYRGPELFAPGVVAGIARASKGLTRRVNLIADKTLLAAFAEKTHWIGRRHVRAALRDSEFGSCAQPWRRWTAVPTAGWTAVAAAAAVAVGMSLHASPDNAAARAASGSDSPMQIQRPAAAGADASFDGAAAASRHAHNDTKTTAHDATERHIGATHAWLQSPRASGYMIQLLASNELHVRNNIENLAEIIEAENLYLYRSVARGKPAVNVLWGTFETRHAAQEAMKGLPGFLLRNKPYIRSAVALRAEMQRERDPPLR